MRSRIGVLILSALLLTSGCLGIGEGVEPPTVLGCMDEEAVNFDSNANEDDGSCEFEQPPPPPPVAGLPEEIPAHFAEWMAAPVNGTTYHFDVNEPCANDSNDGLSGTCDGSGGGPWVTFYTQVQQNWLSPSALPLLRRLYRHPGGFRYVGDGDGARAQHDQRRAGGVDDRGALAYRAFACVDYEVHGVA